MTDATTAPQSEIVTETGLPPEGADAVPYALSGEKMVKDTLLFMLLLFVVFYFMLIRPQQKKFKTHQDMLKLIKKGDKVITAGGIIGEVTKLEGDDIAVVEIAPSVKVKIARGTITQRVSDEPASAKTANDN